MATLMEDPVILPSSKVTIDRHTIKIHLLSDPKDPFNREPLKLEDVIPSMFALMLLVHVQRLLLTDEKFADTELKQQIEAWVKEKRAGKSSAVDPMDVDV